ncbi:MAG: GDSL-type esterase/lipase family protein [Verrucomicrobia bacterium]|nr:GDSL-type esterase/lipase family protein [Verrucomicrobiota bacterium]MDA1005485.1 GDSL-type esterase/lipase family protein [Verrucomicrobiota bacterium]
MRRFVFAALLVALLPTPVVAETAVVDLGVPATDERLPGAGPLRRANWFTKLWLSKRTAWAGRVQADQGALVFLGDSITQGWGDQMGGNFAGVKVANRGISGDTTRGVLVRLPLDVLALNPKGVVLLIGTNDLEDKVEPEVIAGNVGLILAELAKHDAKLPVVLCKVMPSSASKSRSAEQIKRVNALYEGLVKDLPQVTLVETWLPFADEQGDAKKAEFPDLLHPNKVGYAKWAAAIRPVLATLGFVETEAEAFTVEEGFESLFNGEDLSGWGYRVQKTLEKTNAFDGKKASDDGRYVAVKGRLVVTTPSEGRRFQQLWTTKEFEGDFTLKLEFRATPNADSGVFLFGPQLQCRDYTLAGPWTELKSYKPQEWNELLVVAKDGVAHCSCNGEVLDAAFKVPGKGPIGLEGDRGQMEYRRIRIRVGE